MWRGVTTLVKWLSHSRSCWLSQVSERVLEAVLERHALGDLMIAGFSTGKAEQVMKEAEMKLVNTSNFSSDHQWSSSCSLSSLFFGC